MCKAHKLGTLIYDKFLHAAFSYDNGVLIAFLLPWQILGRKCWQKLETELSEDDATDIIEQGTTLVIAGLAVVANYQHTALKSPSSKDRLPNLGGSWNLTSGSPRSIKARS